MILNARIHSCVNREETPFLSELGGFFSVVIQMLIYLFEVVDIVSFSVFSLHFEIQLNVFIFILFFFFFLALLKEI